MSMATMLGLSRRYTLSSPFRYFCLNIVIFLSLVSFVATKIEGRFPHISHSYLDEFDLLNIGDVDDKSHTARSSSSTIPSRANQEPIKTVHFKSSKFGRNFSLVLHQSEGLLSPGFRVFTINGDGRKDLYNYNNDNQIYEGKLENEPNSQAHLTYLESSRSSSQSSRLFTAHVISGGDSYIIDPTYLHKSNIIDNSSNRSEAPEYNLDDTIIVYKIPGNFSDDNYFGNLSKKIRHQCQSIHYDDLYGDKNRTESQHSKNVTILEHISVDFESLTKERLKRDADTKFITVPSKMTSKRTRCSMLIVVDTLFFQNIGRESMTATVNYVLALMERVNKIFLSTVWTNEDSDKNDPLMTGYGFTVQEVVVHSSFHKISDGRRHYNMESEELWEARDFLENFSLNVDTRWYCLAHLLTHRRFTSSVLGLAFVASPRPGSIGGICSERADSRGMNAYFNTGISTSKTSSGETLITRQADLVVAHELGHNFGAEHDPERCSPKSSKGGAYLMHTYSVTGFEPNHRVFSSCSRESIAQVLRRKADICFSSPVEGVCGNGVVDKGEECDGGSLGLRNQDTCCDETCHLKAGAQCSDTHSLCCSNCNIVTVIDLACRQPDTLNCKQASYCDGMSAECPPSPPIADGARCVSLGSCRAGECLPFCESKGLVSCLCETRGDECRMCCRTPFNDTCAPFDKRNRQLDLPDGTLCYRGVCDNNRCEEAVQDFVERFWDIVEDINLPTLEKFLKDNIVGVILLASIPIWLLCCHFIDQFDAKLKEKLEQELRARKAGNGSKGSYGSPGFSLPSMSNQVGPNQPNIFVPSGFFESGGSEHNESDSPPLHLRHRSSHHDSDNHAQRIDTIGFKIPPTNGSTYPFEDNGQGHFSQGQYLLNGQNHTNFTLDGNSVKYDIVNEQKVEDDGENDIMLRQNPDQINSINSVVYNNDDDNLQHYQDRNGQKIYSTQV